MLLSVGSFAADNVHEAWVARYDGPAHADDEAKDIAVSEDGYVYVVGWSRGGDTGKDVVTVKYGADGSEHWLARYDGPAGLHESGYALTLAHNGDVIVTGGTYDSLPNSKILTVCYDTDGIERWAATYEGPVTGENYGYGIASDENGVYVAGYSWGGSSREDAVTIKYAHDGTELWVARYEGPVNGLDSCSKIALGGDGSVYVVGRSMGGYTSYDILTIKYDSDGNEQWVARYDGEVSFDDRGTCIAVDDRGAVCVAGVCWGGWSPGTQWDYVTIQYDEDGNEEWVAIYDGPASGYDIPYGIGIESVGNVCVTGGSAESGSDITNFDYDYVTIRYDSLGNQLWLDRYEGKSDGYDTAQDLVIDSDGSLYVTGSSAGRAGFYRDFTTIKYSADGNTEWVVRYNGPMDDSDYANALALDEAANIYVTGGSNNTWDDRDFATIKYAPGPADTSGVPSISLAISRNPCHGDVSFHVEVPSDVERAKLEVFDLCGRRVRTLLDGSVTGTADVYWDGRDAIGCRAASGVYFVRLRSDGHDVCRKLVLAR